MDTQRSIDYEYETNNPTSILGTYFFDFLSTQDSTKTQGIYTSFLNYTLREEIPGESLLDKSNTADSIRPEEGISYTNHIRDLVGYYLLKHASPDAQRAFNPHNKRVCEIIIQLAWIKIQKNPKAFIRKVFEFGQNDYEKERDKWVEKNKRLNEKAAIQSGSRDPVIRVRTCQRRKFNKIFRTATSSRRVLPCPIPAQQYAKRRAYRTGSVFETALHLNNTTNALSSGFDDFLLLSRLRKTVDQIIGIQRISDSAEAKHRQCASRNIEVDFHYDPDTESVDHSFSLNSDGTPRKIRFDDLCLELFMGMATETTPTLENDEGELVKPQELIEDTPTPSEPSALVSVQDFIRVVTEIREEQPTPILSHTKNEEIPNDTALTLTTEIQKWIEENDPTSPLAWILKSKNIYPFGCTKKDNEAIINLKFTSQNPDQKEGHTHLRLKFTKDDQQESLYVEALETIKDPQKGGFVVLPQAQISITKKISTNPAIPDCTLSEDTEHPASQAMMQSMQRRLASSQSWQRFCAENELTVQEQQIFLRYASYALRRVTPIVYSSSTDSFGILASRFAFRDFYETDIKTFNHDQARDTPPSTPKANPTIGIFPRRFTGEWPKFNIKHLVNWGPQAPPLQKAWDSSFPKEIPPTTGSPLGFNYARIVRGGNLTKEELRLKLSDPETTSADIQAEIDWLEKTKAEGINEKLYDDYCKAVTRAIIDSKSHHSRTKKTLERLQQLSAQGNEKFKQFLNQDPELKDELYATVQNTLKTRATQLETRCTSRIKLLLDDEIIYQRLKVEPFSQYVQLYCLARELGIPISHTTVAPLFGTLAYGYQHDKNIFRNSLSTIAGIYLFEIQKSAPPNLEDPKKPSVDLSANPFQLGKQINKLLPKHKIPSNTGVARFYIPTHHLKSLADKLTHPGEEGEKMHHEDSNERMNLIMHKIINYGERWPIRKLTSTLKDIGLDAFNEYLSTQAPIKVRRFRITLLRRLKKEAQLLEAQCEEYKQEFEKGKTTVHFSFAGLTSTVSLFHICKILGLRTITPGIFRKITTDINELEEHRRRATNQEDGRLSKVLAKIEMIHMIEYYYKNGLPLPHVAEIISDSKAFRNRKNIQNSPGFIYKIVQQTRQTRRRAEKVEQHITNLSGPQITKFRKNIQELQTPPPNSSIPELKDDFVEEIIEMLKLTKTHKEFHEDHKAEQFKTKPDAGIKYMEALGPNAAIEYLYALGSNNYLTDSTIADSIIKGWVAPLSKEIVVTTELGYALISATGAIDYVLHHDFDQPATQYGNQTEAFVEKIFETIPNLRQKIQNHIRQDINATQSRTTEQAIKTYAAHFMSHAFQPEGTT